MSMKNLWPVLFILLSGCSATMETVLSKKSPNAPVNEIDGGIVSYSTDGYKGIVAKRRDNAYKKMHDRCSGPYQIVTDSDQSMNGMITPVGGSAIMAQDHVRYIKFECVDH